jgi:hypothetical protein
MLAAVSEHTQQHSDQESVKLEVSLHCALCTVHPRWVCSYYVPGMIPVAVNFWTYHTERRLYWTEQRYIPGTITWYLYSYQRETPLYVYLYVTIQYTFPLLKVSMHIIRCMDAYDIHDTYST